MIFITFEKLKNTNRMEETLNIILLKPRFKVPLKQDKDFVLNTFKNKLKEQDYQYCSKMGNDHIFIDIPIDQQKIWSPQLELVVENAEEGSVLKGLFAPKPSMWTFFMFLHFITAIAFMIFFALAYANFITGKETNLWYFLMGLSVLMWFFLYFLGQMGKLKAKKQIEELKAFLINSLDTLELKQ